MTDGVLLWELEAELLALITEAFLKQSKKAEREKAGNDSTIIQHY